MQTSLPAAQINCPVTSLASSVDGFPGLGPWRPNQIFDLPKEVALTPHVQSRIMVGALKIVGGNKRISVDGKNVESRRHANEAGKPIPGTPKKQR